MARYDSKGIYGSIPTRKANFERSVSKVQNASPWGMLKSNMRQKIATQKNKERKNAENAEIRSLLKINNNNNNDNIRGAIQRGLQQRSLSGWKPSNNTRKVSRNLLANVEGLTTSTASYSIPTELTKYEKMLKMGIPLGAVEQKMKTNGVNASKIASYMQSKQGKSAAVVAKIPQKIKRSLDEYRNLKNTLDRKSLILAMKENEYNPKDVFENYSNSEYNAIMADVEDEKLLKAKQEEEAKEAKVKANAELQKKLNALSPEEQAEYRRLKPFEQSMFFSPLFRKAKNQSPKINIDYTSKERADIEKIDRLKKEKAALEASIQISLAVKPPIPTAVTKRILDSKVKLKAIDADLVKLQTPELQAKKNAMLRQARGEQELALNVTPVTSLNVTPVNTPKNNTRKNNTNNVAAKKAAKAAAKAKLEAMFLARQQ